MFEINWQNFKAKFYGRESKVFELLAYMLFCDEYDKKIGIFRFKNQTGIETEPITVAGKQIGFQAKYYDTRLSENKEDIISSLKKAKAENNALSKILIYTNQEPSESKTKQVKKPIYLQDIERMAVELALEIDWRVPSNIEIQLSQPQNHYLTAYFFSSDKSVVDFLEELKAHGENILYRIQSDIIFQGNTIKIGRDDLLNRLENLTDQVNIITGNGGCGKTALIKDFLEKTTKPVYVFKAAEFNVVHIADLFSKSHGFTLTDFIKAHEEEQQKIVVIDSAERLADLENQDAFKEFLAALIKNKWQIFFTTRLGYLNDLTFQLLEIYRLNFEVTRIENLTHQELLLLAKTHDFKLPTNQKLLHLIRNLFYLAEYLNHYADVSGSADVTAFRNILWQKKIVNSCYQKGNTHLEREQCFMALVKYRCETGHFYINRSICDNKILAMLTSDEIIQFDDNQDGYFITHDIYEEWALDKIIEREFRSMNGLVTFFSDIGTSLIIRRAFRNWLSDKLGLDISNIRSFIQGIFTNDSIPSFWKDELLVSVLLSDYSEEFFKVFEKALLENNAAYLKKIIFLLRIACKEVDRMVYQEQEVVDLVSFDTSYLITQPKGKGWESCIKLVYEQREQLAITNLTLYFTLFDEWTTNHKTGTATKYAALSALYFLDKEKRVKDLHFNEDTTDRLISIILSGTSEIKGELKVIIDNLMESPLLERHRDNDEILESILTVKYDTVNFVAVLPEEALKLADRFWYQPCEERHQMDHSSLSTEQYYDIPSRWQHDYYPASAYQTPIYWCLQFAFPATIRFILNFTNRAVESYVKHSIDEFVVETQLRIDAETTVKQYISRGLWNIYRGTSSPIAPYLIQSYHMALEKYLLAVSKNVDAELVEKWLVTLLKGSRSASITAIVASIVLAFPDRFFKVAAILFSSYEALQHDNLRLLSEREAESLYHLGVGLGKNKIHEDERLKTLKDPHRKKALENLVLEYQFFSNVGVSEDESSQRVATMYEIIDRHHETVANLGENEETATYRLMLARLDRRKMNPKVELDEDCFIISFNPELSEDLKQVSENAQNQSDHFMRFTKMKLWGSGKFDTSRVHGQYPEYDGDPQQVVKTVRDLVTELQNNQDEGFYFFNRANAAYGCFGLIKIHADSLSENDLAFCRDVLLQFAALPLENQYDYQIGDGTEVAINALPYLYHFFPDQRTEFDTILLLTLFDTHPIGEYKRVCDYAIETILRNQDKLEQEHIEHIFAGYLAFGNKFNDFHKTYIHKVTSSQQPYLRGDMIDEFVEQHKEDFLKWTDHELTVDETAINGLSRRELETAFQLVPVDTSNTKHLNFAKVALPVLAKELLKEDPRGDRWEQRDYKYASDTLKKRHILF